MQAKSKQAFTLVELLVVLVIITVLVGITIPIVSHISARARQAQYEAMMAKIHNALEEYRAKFGEYPITPTYEYKDTNGNWATTNNNLSDWRRHYPRNIATDCYLVRRVLPDHPIAYTNLVVEDNATRIWEEIGYATKVGVDYALTYPLMQVPLLRNERPYIEFDYFTVLYQATSKARKDVGKAGIRIKKNTYRTRSGELVEVERWGRYGWPINRAMALDPRDKNEEGKTVKGKQLKYTSNGTQYSIRTWL
ncbi:MAG: prepilin-type N-terminal cleavage/methylation domain-containing protein [Kiritimatiellia bacterium]|nr:prepilin-type N-terminal cleavage/methylation domain-containing protein [Lentisphaerota bacterium]